MPQLAGEQLQTLRIEVGARHAQLGRRLAGVAQRLQMGLDRSGEGVAVLVVDEEGPGVDLRHLGLGLLGLLQSRQPSAVMR